MEFGGPLLVTGVNQTTSGTEIARLMAQGMRALIIVTSAHHMARALAEIAHALPGVELVAYPVVNDKLRPHDWWRDLARARLLAYEYAKYLIALARMKFVPDVWTRSHGLGPDAK